MQCCLKLNSSSDAVLFEVELELCSSMPLLKHKIQLLRVLTLERVCSAEVGWDGHCFRHMTSHMTRHTSNSTRHMPPGRLLSASSTAPPLPCATPRRSGAMAALGRHETHLNLNLKAVEAQAWQGSCLAPRVQDSARLMRAPVRPASARPASSRTSLGPAHGISARRPGSARHLLFSHTSHMPYKSPLTGNADLCASCARWLCFISASHQCSPHASRLVSSRALENAGDRWALCKDDRSALERCVTRAQVSHANRRVHV